MSHPQYEPNYRPSCQAVQFSLIITFLVLSGCVSNPTIPVVEQIPVLEPNTLPKNAIVRPIVLDRVIFDVPTGTVFGETRRGRLCISPQPLKWNVDKNVFREGIYHVEFEKVMRQYDYPLVDKPKSLFEEFKLSGHELILAAKITNVKENSCYALGGFNLDQRVYLGSVRFSVQWEVYSFSEKRVVFAFDNEGSAMVEEFKPQFDDNYYPRAFGNALRGLLKNADFLKLVTSAPERS